MKIKADNNLKKIPVIILTTSSNIKYIELTYENGCNSNVKKRWRWKIFNSHFADRSFWVAAINTTK
jgi:hypothetical protein